MTIVETERRASTFVAGRSTLVKLVLGALERRLGKSSAARAERLGNVRSRKAMCCAARIAVSYAASCCTTDFFHKLRLQVRCFPTAVRDGSLATWPDPACLATQTDLPTVASPSFCRARRSTILQCRGLRRRHRGCRQ